MERVYENVRPLERAAEEKIGLTEELMIENAAAALEREIAAFYAASAGRRGRAFCGAADFARADGGDTAPENCRAAVKGGVLILCGCGNNGADGYALARRLCGGVPVAVCAVEKPKSRECVRLSEEAVRAGVSVSDFGEICPDGGALRLPQAFSDCAVIADCVYGTGFHGALNESARALFEAVNALDCFRIACDIPSGIDIYGNTPCDGGRPPAAFRADVTVTMGARKAALYGDGAKDFCGRIVCASVGVSPAVFCAAQETDIRVLDASDMRLPFRTRQSVHKGDFGHAAVLLGEKSGAAVIAGTAALRFGAGLVTLTDVFPNRRTLAAVPPELMCGESLPENTSAVLAGSGLGRDGAVLQNAASLVSSWLSANPSGGLVIDADLFYFCGIAELLSPAEKNSGARIVLTPHPKEFQSLLKICGVAEASVQDIVTRRLEYARAFSARFPRCVLVLKGANTVISAGGALYISAEGRPCLAKAGSGDVLAGLLCALLAQGYGAGEAARTAVLAHGLASRRRGEDYSLTPFTLIEAVADLCGRGARFSPAAPR